MQILIKYETGPVAADCYSIVVEADTVIQAKDLIKKRYAHAMITLAQPVDTLTEAQYRTYISDRNS